MNITKIYIYFVLVYKSLVQQIILPWLRAYVVCVYIHTHMYSAYA